MDKLDALRANIRQHKKLCIGFSGGVDSTFLLKVAAEELGQNCIAVIADGVMFPFRELNEAIALASELGVRCEVIEIDALSVPEFAASDRLRCYHCKRNIFSHIKQIAEREGAMLADGKNGDDEHVYRPGQQATSELGVVSPLAEVGLTKEEIRMYSKQLGLRTWDKQANACLVTRLPYDEDVTVEKLRMVEQAEYILHDMGIVVARARLHGNLVRIETDKKDFNKILESDIAKRLKALGIQYVTLDVEGFRSGSMDQGIDQSVN